MRKKLLPALLIPSFYSVFGHASSEVYEIQKGDSISQIAEKVAIKYRKFTFKEAMAEIKELNPDIENFHQRTYT